MISPVPLSFVHALYNGKGSPVIFFLTLRRDSVPSFHINLLSHVSKVTVNGKGICSPWKQGPSSVCANGLLSLAIEYTQLLLIAQTVCVQLLTTSAHVKLAVRLECRCVCCL